MASYEDGADPVTAWTTSHDVFISYSGQDRAWVRALASALRRKEVRAAYDELLLGPGDVIVHELDKAILTSAGGLVVYSQAAIASDWVGAEYATLMHRAIEDGRLFIPVIIEDVPLPPFVKSRYCADFREADASTYDRLVDQIARAVTRSL
jgi:hypothetical protein